MGLAVQVKNVRKSFGNLHAIDDVSIDVEERTITCLIGPNGSGKTTLINVISGYYKPDSGSVSYFDQDITNFPPHKVYRLGLARTFQIPALFWKLTVLENVLVAAKDNPGESFAKSIIKRLWADEESREIGQAFELLQLVGLSHMWDKPASSLSGGQMKLLEIGRALMSGARTLLLDEPISGVNPTLAHDIFGKLVKLRENYGITLFIIEHRLDIALRYVDEVIAMAFGKLVTFGKPQVVMNDPRVIEAYLGA